MNKPLSLQALKEQFNAQSSEMARLQDVLAALDPRLGLEVDSDTLRALEDAFEAPTTPRGPALLPQAGVRA